MRDIGSLVRPIDQHVVPWLIAFRLRLIGLIPSFRCFAGEVHFNDKPSVIIPAVNDYLSRLKRWIRGLGRKPFVQVNHFKDLFLGIKKGPLENERSLK